MQKITGVNYPFHFVNSLMRRESYLKTFIMQMTTAAVAVVAMVTMTLFTMLMMMMMKMTGTDPLSALHSRRSATNRETQPASTRIRLRHTGVQLLLTLILSGTS